MTCHVTCQKYQFYFNMFRTLKPSCVLNLVPSYTLRNITNKLFSPAKAFDPGLKLLEKPVIRAARLICAFSVDKLITEHFPHICILFIFFFTWSVSTNPDQRWTKAVGYWRLFVTIRRYWLFAIRVSRHPHGPLCNGWRVSEKLESFSHISMQPLAMAH